MILFDFPPYLVDRREVGSIQRQITRHQIENASAAISVCEDLLCEQQGEIDTFQVDFPHVST